MPVIPSSTTVMRHDPCRARLRPTLGRISVLALLFLGACAGSDDPIVLGVAAPLADSYGESTKLGAELAVEEINAAGGVDGRPLALRVLDDKADAQTAIDVAEQLVADDRVVAVVGHVYSGTMRAAGDTYNRDGLAAVATSATATDLSQLGPWTFRVAAADSATAVELAKVAQGLGKRISILYLNDDYGRGLTRNFRDALQTAGASVLDMDPYAESTEDFLPYLTRLQRKNADLVFVAGYDVEAARIIKQAREMGITARFMGGDGLEALPAQGSAYNGTLVGVLYHPDASEAARGFADAYRAAFGKDPDSSAALAYDAVKLIARAADAANLKGILRRDRKAIRDELAMVGRPGGSAAFGGVAGTVRFDENGDPLEKDFSVTVAQDGTLRLFNENR